MRHLQHVGPHARNGFGHAGQEARPISAGDQQSRRSSVHHQTAIDDPRDHVDVDVPPRQNRHNALSRRHREKATQQRRQRRGTRSLHDRLLVLQQ